jgi:protein-S-isoprenylcysteine O-methyltransferase Ste14
MQQTVNALFNHPGLRAVLVRSRVVLVPAAAVAVLLCMTRDRCWLWAGLAVSLFGEALQLWCFAALNKNADLVCQGPYALVRNPMYLGRFFIVLGMTMLLGRWWVLPVFAFLYYLYMVNRVCREEERLRGLFGAAYAQYCTVVPRFLPGRPYRGNPVWVWDWTLFRKNHGDRNLLGTLVFWGVAIAWAMCRR